MLRQPLGGGLGCPADALVGEKDLVEVFGDGYRIVPKIFDPSQVPAGGLSECRENIADANGHHRVAFHGWNRNDRFLSLDGYGLGRSQRIAVTIIARGVG